MRNCQFFSTNSIVSSIPSISKVYQSTSSIIFFSIPSISNKFSIFFQQVQYFSVYLAPAMSMKNFQLFFQPVQLFLVYLASAKNFQFFTSSSILSRIPSISKVYEKLSILFQPVQLLLLYLASANSMKNFQLFFQPAQFFLVYLASAKNFQFLFKQFNCF